MLFGVLPLLLAPIVPTDGRIVYVGRFDQTDPAVARCQWSASEVRLRVKGTQLKAEIEEKGDDYWQVVVDGAPKQIWHPKEGVDTYTADLGVDAVHDIRLVKRTEPFVGTTGFRSFDAPGGTFLRANTRRRHIEFVGDSITCAFGNEGANQDEHFKASTENAWLSYASITARNLDADVTILAWSGRKMWPNNTVPEIYDRILPTQETPKYDFRGPKPDVVVINLATNDFGPGNPEEKGWTDAYEAFIRRVWRSYPKAHIYTAIGTMMSDSYPVGTNSLSTLRGYLTRLNQRINDKRLHLVEMEVQKMEDGIGSDWHPNVVTHQKMATTLTAAIQKDLKWK